MKRTPIEWTDFSSNPLQYRDASGRVVWACVKKSSGCANCYSEAIAERFDRGGPFTNATMAKLTPFLDAKELSHILTAKTVDGKEVAGSRCFLGDMTDVFGEWVPDAILDQLFAAIAMRRDLTFQILTKRPDRMAAYFTTTNRRRLIAEQVMPLSNMLATAARSHTARLKMDDFEDVFLTPGPFRNVWLGTSVENQAAADERIPHLLSTPAAVLYLSCEPLLGDVDLINLPEQAGYVLDALRGRIRGLVTRERMAAIGKVDWVIVGGESGRDSRPMQIEWARGLVEQCKEARVACFVKQMGSCPTTDSPQGTRIALPLSDAKGGMVSDWPGDLRVREFPVSA